MNLSATLASARHAVVFTGAGVSAESGIPTFREPLTGLWSRFDPADLACADAFRRDPALVWGWYEWRRSQMLMAAPNPAHGAIAELENHFESLTVVTQNVDDLHERAGSRTVIHLHGSLLAPRCFACARPYRDAQDPQIAPQAGGRLEPPRCAHCKCGRIRPGVVWFGEALPPQAWSQARRAVLACDVLFCVGTSSVVFPAAELPLEALRRKKPLIQVNAEPTRLDTLATFNLPGSAAQILPGIVAALESACPTPRAVMEEPKA